MRKQFILVLLIIVIFAIQTTVNFLLPQPVCRMGKQKKVQSTSIFMDRDWELLGGFAFSYGLFDGGGGPFLPRGRAASLCLGPSKKAAWNASVWKGI